ncbi:MAG TPA: hypothetical protein VF718_00085 [Allosphingosinicella sp.]|jgi:hypothetical protein
MSLPPAPYPDGSPEDFSCEQLDQGVRAAGSIAHFTNGDFIFSTGLWRTVHGPAVVVRMDEGASKVWGARMPDGRRVHCRRSREPCGPRGPWRRRSDDGRSWVVGEIRFEPGDVHFTDGLGYFPQPELDGNVFERAMADKAEFRARLRDDSFAFTLNRRLWSESLYTMDLETRWEPGRGHAAETIAKLRGFGETFTDFKYGGPEPEPPWTDPWVVDEVLADAGWRLM